VSNRWPIAPAAVLLLLNIGLAACQHAPTAKEDMLASLQHLPGDTATETPTTNGAIYQTYAQGGAGLSLFRDHRPWQVGDIVTVQIIQAATATKNVSQNINRNDNNAGTVNAQLGWPLGASGSPTSYTANLANTTANGLQGNGATAQSDSFAATMSTMVQRIRPNGDLVIAGEEQVQLVGGKEFIRLAGVVRPEDVLNNNVVQSQQMAEAHIEFSGDGETYLAPKMGLAQRLFLTVSMLWPGDWFK
jgi:flagellar L-ring protein precursor FlgH